jgi:hypothetical protein
VNFNVQFNVLLSQYIVQPLVKIKKDFDNIKMHGTTTKKISICVFIATTSFDLFNRSSSTTVHALSCVKCYLCKY